MANSAFSSTLDNFFSPDINECSTDGFTCPENATCENWIPGYKCPCNRGFKEVKEGINVQCVGEMNYFHFTEEVLGTRTIHTLEKVIRLSVPDKKYLAQSYLG